MSMSIVISDQYAEMVQTHVANYGSVEDVIKSAILRLHNEDQEQDNPEFIEYLRAAIAEAEADDSPSVEWNPEEFKRECHRQWNEMHGETCHT